MNRQKELLTSKDFLPMNLSIFTIESSDRYWHQSIEIIYVLSGSLEIKCGTSNNYILNEDDIILINTFDIHDLNSKNCDILSLKINISALDSELSYFARNKYDCNSSIESDKKKFLPLKRLLALIVKNNVAGDKNVNLLNKSYIYRVFYILDMYFKVEDTTENQNSNKNSERMKNILNYINENYMNKITLNDLSNNFYLSVPYLSKIFKDFTSLSFSEYLNEIRISHAVSDLSNFTYTIEHIADKNGFSNTRSFVSCFKNKYGCNPSKYRKNLSRAYLENSQSFMENINYLDLHHNNSFYRLVNYLKTDDIITESTDYPTTISEISSIDFFKKSIPLNHNFKNLICVGRAKHILNSEIKDMLFEIQKDIGFKYIRFHGLLDDEMMLYSEDEDNNVELCFNYIDLIIDYLLSINLKPFVELSFMPKELAKTPERTMFFIKSIISLPKDISKWKYLIKGLVNHLISRYGNTEVESWPFFLWNEPDLINMFGFENQDEFFYFYKETYKTIKDVNKNISFGSSPVFSDTLVSSNTWMDSFIEFCKLNNCIPDYITMHFYPMNLCGQNPLTISKKSHLEMQKYLLYSESENTLKDDITLIKNRLHKYNLNPNRLFLVGWNSSISHNELLNDTVYKSAYIAKNILENYDSLESFGYWQISDFNEEVKTKKELFHGGQGIFTYNGIKKSHYYVFKMLNKLGDNLLKKGTGFFITKNNNSIQIILYNYEHYSKLYGSGEIFDMTDTDRYTPFVKPHKLKVIIPFTNIPEKTYKLTETVINRSYGSSFDKYLEVGGLPLDNNEDINYLKSISIPKVQKKIIHTQNNTLSITAVLEPHEVRLIEITPYNA